MFTGIVQDVGCVRTLESLGAEARLEVEVDRLNMGAVAIGDSVCVQGCCVTVTAIKGGAFAADLSSETLSRTTLGALRPGQPVNLEPALRAGEPLGGHLVTGHVDGVARVVARAGDARSLRLTIEAPPALAPYLARKGSVALDGVSLTVNEVSDRRFGVNLIPHTQAVTTLGALDVDARVNLEVDPIARYVERLMGLGKAERTSHEDRLCASG